jgi:hypothetical protein
MTQPRIDYAGVTKNQQQIWATGDFAVIALAIVPVSEALVLSADPTSRAAAATPRWPPRAATAT